MLVINNYVYEYTANCHMPNNSERQYSAILDSEQLPLLDRIAFACIHLPEHPLIEQLAKWTRAAVNSARIDALALTALAADSVDCMLLLQRLTNTLYIYISYTYMLYV